MVPRPVTFHVRCATRREARPARGERSTGRAAPQKTEAERFVEELALESAAASEPEDSVVVGSIDELRGRVAGLQAEVRAQRGVWRRAPLLAGPLHSRSRPMPTVQRAHAAADLLFRPPHLAVAAAAARDAALQRPPGPPSSCTVRTQPLCLSPPSPLPQVADMDKQIDALYRSTFRGITATLPPPPAAPAPPPPAGPRAPAPTAPAAATPAEPETLAFPDGVSEAEFGDLGRARPEAMRALLEAKEAADADGWRAFQSGVATAKLKRQRVVGRLAEATGLLNAAERAAAKAGLAAAAAASEDEEELAAAPAPAAGGLLQQLLGRGAASTRGGAGALPEGAPRPVRIVLICGFESFNVGLYQQAARRLARRAPHVTLEVRRRASWSAQVARAGVAGAGRVEHSSS
jgi:hypothetical protein